MKIHGGRQNADEILIKEISVSTVRTSASFPTGMGIILDLML